MREQEDIENPGKQHVEKLKRKLDDHLAKISDIPEQHILNPLL